MSSSILTSLEKTFGAIPVSLCEHIKYLNYDDDREEFTCNLCDKIIQKSSPKTLIAHLMSKSHKEESSTIYEIEQSLKKTFQGNIPQNIQNNIDVLDINEDDYECVICCKILRVSKDVNISEANFSYHLSSSGHETNLIDYDAKIETLRDVFGGIPLVVQNNQEFLRLDGSRKNYVCSVCHVLLIVNENDLEETKEEFTTHFYSSGHITRVKLFKIKTIIPELQQSNARVPTYLMRNIDYLSTNDMDFFCSLCNENIKRNHYDINETKENLKLHLLSQNHEENMFGRQDRDDDVFYNLNEVIEDFTDEVLKNLKYLELTKNYFSCSICNENICIKSNCDDVKDNIIFHFESNSHQSEVLEEMQRRKSLIEDFEDMLGGIPPLIKENITYIQFKGSNNFECTLCKVTLQSKKNCDDIEYVKQITQENFERHLSSVGHTQALANKDEVSTLLGKELEDLFDPIPDCIYNNWDNLEYEVDSGHFRCVSCDQTIIVDDGNKQAKITVQNFVKHLFSGEHIANVKYIAKRKIQASGKLELIFGGVPGYILSNVEYLYQNEEDEDSYFCDACQAKIRLGSCPETTKQNFHQHLGGSRHKTNIERIETSIGNAFQYLDCHFCVPEFLLRDIDFWSNSKDDDDLYCDLCQVFLPVNLQNLRRTRLSIQTHMESGRHKSNMGYYL